LISKTGINFQIKAEEGDQANHTRKKEGLSFLEVQRLKFRYKRSSDEQRFFFVAHRLDADKSNQIDTIMSIDGSDSGLVVLLCVCQLFLDS